MFVLSRFSPGEIFCHFFHVYHSFELAKLYKDTTQNIVYFGM